MGRFYCGLDYLGLCNLFQSIGKGGGHAVFPELGCRSDV